MMNIVEKIVIERERIFGATITMLDANDRVINTIKTTEMLANDDYVIDRETIAELCGMTLDTLKRFYYLDSAGYCKVIDYGVILTEAEFTKKDEFEILLDAIQNGDIEITDDEPEDDEYMDSICIAYDRARGYYLEQLVSNNNGEIDFIDYVSNDGSEKVRLTRDDLYIDGIELLDFYEDDDYGFKTALRARILRKMDGFQEAFEDYRAVLSESAKSLKQIGTKTKAEETVVEVPKEEPVMAPNNNIVIAKIQELMVKALEEGDFDAYDKLEERLNRISK